MTSSKPLKLRLLLMALAGIIIALAFFARLRFIDQERTALQTEMDGQFRLIQKVVREELEKQNAELERFAQRMAASPSDEYWQATALSVLNDQKGILALGYVDKSLEIRWAVPAKYVDSLVKTHAGIRANHGMILSEVLEKGRVKLSEPMLVADQGRAFLAYYPLKRGDGPAELLVAVLHLQVLVDGVLGRVVPKDFAVAMLDGYTEIYSRGGRQVRSQAAEYSGSLTVGTAKWGLKMWPGPATLAGHKTDWPQWSLFGGAFLALLILGLAFMPMPSGEENTVRPAATPAEWSRRWESALKDSLVGDAGASGGPGASAAIGRQRRSGRYEAAGRAGRNRAVDRRHCRHRRRRVRHGAGNRGRRWHAAGLCEQVV